MIVFLLSTILILFITFFVIYNIIIIIYCKVNGKISYKYLIKMINIVSEDNFFMNYGLWDENIDNLKEANKNLIQFVFDKTKINGLKNKTILDVGCGYGEQDILFSTKIDKTCKITAIDISEEQIYNAIERANKQDITCVKYEICDALFINKKFKNEQFDYVISIESAFHYYDRPYFYKNVKDVLSPDGLFVITDIVLKDNYTKNIYTSLFIYLYSTCMSFPKQNLITADEWDRQLKKKFNIIDIYDVTENTFDKYYEYFMNNFTEKLNWPIFMKSLLKYIFKNYQPFSYRIAVCKKRK
jgi:2-polyprenyl-3-methyl-5-hydroxy-6-metoxy-1,4-benzoquinol methylase